MSNTKQTSIVSKMAFSIILLITVGMCVLGVFITSHLTQTLQSQMVEFGKTVARQLAETSIEPVLSSDTLGLRVVATNLVQNENVMGAAIFSENGTILAEAGATPNLPIADIFRHAEQIEPNYYRYQWTLSTDKSQESISSFFSNLLINKQYGLVSFSTPIKFRQLTTGYALVSFNYDHLNQATFHSIKIIGLGTLLLILLTALTAFAISRRMAKPIRDLMEATKKMSDGNYTYQITERRNDEIGVLMNTFNRMTQGLLQKSQVEQILSQFVSPGVAHKMLENVNDVELGGKKVTATVLFADIVGFTNMSEQLPPEDVAELLNEYFSYISQASSYYKGTIDKFMGDCAMVIFGVPNDDVEHRFHAICCANMIRHLSEQLNQRREEQGKPPVHLRIGINSGEMLAGNLGSMDRMQYTVVGDAVNLASRLANVANGGEIIIAESLFVHPDVRGRISANQKDFITLRGIKEPVNTYLVQNIATTYRSIMENNVDKMLSDNVQPEKVLPSQKDDSNSSNSNDSSNYTLQ